MGRRVEVHAITSAQPGPTAEFRHRERQYLLLMGLRMVAIVVAVLVPGIWRWVAAAAGIALPYFAVVLVNAVKVRGTPQDPNYRAPEGDLALSDVPHERLAIAETPFEGRVIRHEP